MNNLTLSLAKMLMQLLQQERVLGQKMCKWQNTGHWRWSPSKKKNQLGAGWGYAISWFFGRVFSLFWCYVFFLFFGHNMQSEWQTSSCMHGPYLTLFFFSSSFCTLKLKISPTMLSEIEYIWHLIQRTFYLWHLYHEIFFKVLQLV